MGIAVDCKPGFETPDNGRLSEVTRLRVIARSPIRVRLSDRQPTRNGASKRQPERAWRVNQLANQTSISLTARKCLGCRRDFSNADFASACTELLSDVFELQLHVCLKWCPNVG